MDRTIVDGRAYAICKVVASLDALLGKHLEKWNVSKGFSIEWKDRMATSSRDVVALVQPIGWDRGDHIYIRLRRDGDGWYVFEGLIDNKLLREQGDCQFFFKVVGSSIEARPATNDAFLKFFI